MTTHGRTTPPPEAQAPVVVDAGKIAQASALVDEIVALLADKELVRQASQGIPDIMRGVRDTPAAQALLKLQAEVLARRFAQLEIVRRWHYPFIRRAVADGLDQIERALIMRLYQERVGVAGGLLEAHRQAVTGWALQWAGWIKGLIAELGLPPEERAAIWALPEARDPYLGAADNDIFTGGVGVWTMTMEAALETGEAELLGMHLPPMLGFFGGPAGGAFAEALMRLLARMGLGQARGAGLATQIGWNARHSRAVDEIAKLVARGLRRELPESLRPAEVDRVIGRLMAGDEGELRRFMPLVRDGQVGLAELREAIAAWVEGVKTTWGEQFGLVDFAMAFVGATGLRTRPRPPGGPGRGSMPGGGEPTPPRDPEVERLIQEMEQAIPGAGRDGPWQAGRATVRGTGGIGDMVAVLQQARRAGARRIRPEDIFVLREQARQRLEQVQEALVQARVAVRSTDEQVALLQATPEEVARRVLTPEDRRFLTDVENFSVAELELGPAILAGDVPATVRGQEKMRAALDDLRELVEAMPEDDPVRAVVIRELGDLELAFGYYVAEREAVEMAVRRLLEEQGNVIPLLEDIRVALSARFRAGIEAAPEAEIADAVAGFHRMLLERYRAIALEARAGAGLRPDEEAAFEALSALVEARLGMFRAIRQAGFVRGVPAIREASDRLLHAFAEARRKVAALNGREGGRVWQIMHFYLVAVERELRVEITRAIPGIFTPRGRAIRRWGLMMVSKDLRYHRMMTRQGMAARLHLARLEPVRFGRIGGGLGSYLIIAFIVQQTLEWIVWGPGFLADMTGRDIVGSKAANDELNRILREYETARRQLEAALRDGEVELARAWQTRMEQIVRQFEATLDYHASWQIPPLGTALFAGIGFFLAMDPAITGGELADRRMQLDALRTGVVTTQLQIEMAAAGPGVEMTPAARRIQSLLIEAGKLVMNAYDVVKRGAFAEREDLAFQLDRALPVIAEARRLFEEARRGVKREVPVIDPVSGRTLRTEERTVPLITDSEVTYFGATLARLEADPEALLKRMGEIEAGREAEATRGRERVTGQRPGGRPTAAEGALPLQVNFLERLRAEGHITEEELQQGLQNRSDAARIIMLGQQRKRQQEVAPR